MREPATRALAMTRFIIGRMDRSTCCMHDKVHNKSNDYVYLNNGA